jgi:hypothetical protein
MSDRVVSTWNYADQVGGLLFMLVSRYSEYYHSLNQMDAKGCHLAYMRPCFATLQTLYDLIRPLVMKTEAEKLDKQLEKTRNEMELYLSELQRDTTPSDYRVMLEIEAIYREILVRMQFAGLLYRSEKYITDSERLEEAYGVRKRPNAMFPVDSPLNQP